MKEFKYAIYTPPVWNLIKTKGSKGQFKNYETVIVDETQCYTGWRVNGHHWTTNYVWKHFIPMITQDLDIQFNASDYLLKEFVVTDVNGVRRDCSYHVLNKNQSFTLIDLQKDRTWKGDQSILRDLTNEFGYCYTQYHSLYRCSHASSLIINNSLNSNKNLVINSDSMSIPVLPILANYFKKILLIDVRDSVKKYGFQERIKELNPDYLVHLFWTKFPEKYKQIYK